MHFVQPKYVAERKCLLRPMQSKHDSSGNVYTCLPFHRLDECRTPTPWATQRISPYDRMNADIATSEPAKKAQDEWHVLVTLCLPDMIRQHAIPVQPMQRRKSLFGDPKIATITL